jgi:hypothetical protein
MSRASEKKDSMLWQTGYDIKMGLSNAAPEWQAWRLGWRSRELLEACPLEGCVRSVAPQQTTSAHLRINSNIHLNHGLTKGIAELILGSHSIVQHSDAGDRNDIQVVVQAFTGIISIEQQETIIKP